jgi:hypothetical protein
MVVVVVLPLFELLVEQVNVVGDPVLVQELVKLLVVDPVRALDLAVEVRRPSRFRPCFDAPPTGHPLAQ